MGDFFEGNGAGSDLEAMVSENQKQGKGIKCVAQRIEGPLTLSPGRR